MVNATLFRVMRMAAGIAVRFAAIAVCLALAIVVVIVFQALTLPTRVIGWARRG